MKQVKSGDWLLRCECCHNILIIHDWINYEDVREKVYTYGWEIVSHGIDGHEYEVDFCPICAEPDEDPGHA